MILRLLSPLYSPFLLTLNSMIVYACVLCVVATTLFVVKGDVYLPYVQTSSQVLVSGISSLDQIDVTGGLFGGGFITVQGSSALLVCSSTQSGDARTTLERSYIFTIVDSNCCNSYSKFVRVHLEILSNVVYVYASDSTVYSSDVNAASSCDTANLAFANGTSMPLATSSSADGYGIYSISYSVFALFDGIYNAFLTTDPALVMSGLSELSTFSLTGGQFNGRSITSQGNSATLVCTSTQADDKSSNEHQAYIFALADDVYSKFVRVYVDLIDSGVYFYANETCRYTSGFSGTSSCDAVNSAFATGSVNSLSTSSSITGYGVYNVLYEYGVAGTPSASPTYRPTSAPWFTGVYSPYLTTSSAVVECGVDSLATFSLTGGQFNGHSITAKGSDALLICASTQSGDTTSNVKKAYIFTLADDGYSKLVRVYVEITDNDMYFYADTGRFVVGTSAAASCSTYLVQIHTD